jgi:ABC-2 type transport system permease protein
MTLIEDLRVIRSAARTAVISSFTVLPPWLWLLQIFSVSLFSMAFFAFVAAFADNPEISVAYIALGNALQSLAFSTVYSVTNLSGIEKHMGTLQVVLASPTRIFKVFLGKSLFQIVTGIITVIVSLSYAVFIFGVDFSQVNLLSLSLIVIMTTLAMLGFGLMISSLGLYFRSNVIMGSLFMYMSLIFSGVNFPVSYLPEFLQPISYLLPMTYGVSGLREAAQGATVLQILPSLGAMALLGSFMAFIGFLLFKRLEKMSLERGTLDLF